jgi:mRNA-degrading endonuclease RelE of RelBE toxin-antitoxin system
MPKIKIIRAAFREIQQLSPFALNKVREIMRRLSQADYRNTKFLEGYDELLRTELDKLRVIWQWDKEGDVLIVKAGWRKDVYRGDIKGRHRGELQVWSEVIDTPAASLAEIPAYQWNHEKDEDWYKFVYGGYRYSPILTTHQRTEFNELLAIASATSDTKAWIVQSAPGTGKTLCATLLACEIHSLGECRWNTMLIVPEALRRDIAQYSEVKQAQKQKGFWLGTFREWLSFVDPQLGASLAKPEQEFLALQEATRMARLSGKRSPKPQDITTTDVLLYQVFVLDEANGKQRNAIYRVNVEKGRIEALKQIEQRFWKEALSKLGSICRLDAANHLKSNLPKSPNNADRTLLIIDEAQDFMLAELQAIIAVFEAWAKQGHPTYLWVLGDLNQRIQPTDFIWGQLHLGEPLKLQRNYRNSRHILEFANQFWEFAKQENSRLKGRGKDLPEPANPEDAVEDGEPVLLLECASITEANDFLKQLDRESGRTEDRRYLLHELANSVKVMFSSLREDYPNLVLLNAAGAKGREFEACVAFCIFQGTGKPSLEDSFQWYTMLTRARSRLLVVATTEEIERVGRKYFAGCEFIDADRAISWITEVASDVDLNQITDDVERRLLERCRSGYPYWDSYLALQLAGIEEKRLYEWEQEAISLLSQHSTSHLEGELQKTQNIFLRCLLLRSLGCSWEAVAEAEQLEKSDRQEYERLLERIAKDLELKNLPYEAARVRLLLGYREASINLPFWEEVSTASNQSQPLVTLLCGAFTSRLDNFLQDLNG